MSQEDTLRPFARADHSTREDCVTTEGQPRIPDRLPLLPLKGTVVFPYQVQGLGVGRKKSLRAL